LKNKGKTFGKIIAALTLLLSVAVFVFGSHFDGETKAVTKFFDAIERKDQTAFDKFSEKSFDVTDIHSEIVVQSGILTMAKTLEAGKNDKTKEAAEDFDFKVEFPSGATVKPGGDDWRLPIKLTVYNDYDHVVFDDAIAHMTYIGGRWRVFDIDLA
jgi:hypothetical protein